VNQTNQSKYAEGKDPDANHIAHLLEAANLPRNKAFRNRVIITRASSLAHHRSSSPAHHRRRIMSTQPSEVRNHAKCATILWCMNHQDS
jgi:hypothetical protein